MEFSHSGRELIPLKSLIKEVIDRLGIDSEKLKFASSYTAYEDNNGTIFVTTNTSMTPTAKQISIKYHWYSQHVGK